MKKKATVNPDEKKTFIRIIDEFLRTSDLTTITLRNVRSHLQDEVGYDLGPFKDDIRSIITARFDEILTERDGGDASNVKEEVKTEHEAVTETPSDLEPQDTSMNTPGVLEKTPSKRKQNLDKDAELAAKLHEELNAGRSRSGSSTQKKKVSPKKPAGKKRKSEVTTDVSGDEAGGLEKKKRAINRNNPFNAPMQLSEALSELIGKTECSRPECVKSIWAYVKERDLQDPTDKRYIICDDPMKRVFNGASRVHMFTMNKVLSNHIFPMAKSEKPAVL